MGGTTNEPMPDEEAQAPGPVAEAVNKGPVDQQTSQEDSLLGFFKKRSGVYEPGEVKTCIWEKVKDLWIGGPRREYSRSRWPCVSL